MGKFYEAKFKNCYNPLISFFLKLDRVPTLTRFVICSYYLLARGQTTKKVGEYFTEGTIIKMLREEKTTEYYNNAFVQPRFRFLPTDFAL